MKNILLQILIVFILSSCIFAQNAEQKTSMVAEFGKVSLEEIAAYLDELGNELKKYPTNKALIRIYGGQGEYLASPYIRGSIIKAYLKKNRKLSPESFLIQFCNINRVPLKTQFFIVDGNEEIGSCDEDPATPKETVLFETLYFYGKSSFSSEKPF